MNVVARFRSSSAFRQADTILIQLTLASSIRKKKYCQVLFNSPQKIIKNFADKVIFEKPPTHQKLNPPPIA